MGKPMAKESTHGRMVKFTMGNGKAVRKKAMVFGKE
jgi:hypothetical protein